MKLKILTLGLMMTAMLAGAKPEMSTPALSPVRVEVAGDRLVILKPAGVYMQFYLFDMEGNLVLQRRLKNTRELVDDLDKGTYLYSALKNDDLVASGYVSIK